MCTKKIVAPRANQITLKEMLCYVIHQVDTYTMAVYIGHAQFNKFSELLNAQNLNDDVRKTILEGFASVTKYSPENMKSKLQKNSERTKKYIEKKKEDGVDIRRLRYEQNGQSYYQQNKERLNKRKVELARLKREAAKQQQSQPHEVNFNGVISV